VGKSQLLRNLYVDQQTGEMRLSSSDRTINQELEMDRETNHIRRYHDYEFTYNFCFIIKLLYTLKRRVMSWMRRSGGVPLNFFRMGVGHFSDKGERGVLQMETFAHKTSDFSKFIMCPPGQGGHFSDKGWREINFVRTCFTDGSLPFYE